MWLFWILQTKVLKFEMLLMTMQCSNVELNKYKLLTMQFLNFDII